MEKLLDKLTSYNLFNYLLPGVVFLFFLEKTTSYYSIGGNSNLIVDAFVAYFIGLIISRIGSLVIEPLFKKVSFVKYADYKDFVLVSKIDPKIELLSEANNMYRTFISLFSILVLTICYEKLSMIYPFLETNAKYLLIISILLLFMFAYKKQVGYINKRISISKNTDEGTNT